MLTAFAASGLRPTEFARQAGVPVKRVWQWRERLGMGPRRRSPTVKPVRLVELVPARLSPEATVPALVTIPEVPMIDVVTPSGWQLRVPGEMLAHLVYALSC